MPAHRATVTRTPLLPRLVTGALCTVALGAAVAFVAGIAHERPNGRSAAVAPAADHADHPREAAASAVLQRWDDARARAWARADPRELARLYTPRSAAGRRDVAMLIRWRERGLRVDGMRTELLALEVVDHAAGSLVLEVTDRLVGAVAEAPGVRSPLPADRPSTRRVTLRRVAGEWRVAAVRPIS